MQVYNEIQPETAVLWLKNDNPDAPLFFFIPGNPGLAEYYQEYFAHLQHHMPEFEYFCPSHIGFNTLSEEKGWLTGRVYTLDEQIQHKIDLLRKFCEANPKRKVVIMGHSVGAWMVQRVVVACSNLDIKFVGLLTPTIQDIAGSEKGARLVMVGDYLTKQPGTIFARVGQLVYWTMPQVVVRAGIKLSMGRAGRLSVPDHAIEATNRMLCRPNILRQFADMGAEEMVRIAKEPADEVAPFWNGRYKIWVHFVNQDHWVKDETREEIVQRYGNQDNVEIGVAGADDPIVHAFCVRHSEPFAHLTLDKVKNAL